MIGHNVILHGCTIGDDSLIGMGAILLNGAKIGKNSLVGAGSVVTEGKTFPDNSLIVGAPARAIRTLDEKLAAMIRDGADIYVRALEAIRQGPEADRLKSGGCLCALDLRRGAERDREPVPDVDGGDRGG